MQAIVPISTPQYDLVDRISYYTNYKRQRGINGAIPILVAHAQLLPYLNLTHHTHLTYQTFSLFFIPSH
jgi:hypothetical protein